MTLKLNFTRRFEKSCRSCDATILDRAQEALKTFSDNKGHPGLNFEQVKGTAYFTIRVTKGYRIFLREAEDGGYDVIELANHDRYRQLG